MANTICAKQFHGCSNVVHATGFACMYGDPESEPIFRLPKQ
ncbi:adenosine deaminase [Pseudomonas aeruginosa]|nr:adenosine deaminase [Pseudomonas aeruginosa]